MPLDLLLGPAGARKTGRLLDAHQRAARDARAAWLVVPSGADLVPIRRELLGLDAPSGQPRTPTPYADLLGAPELERRLLRLAGGPGLLSQDQRRLVAQAVIRDARLEGRLEALLPGARRGWLADELVDLSAELTLTGDLGGPAEAALEAWGGGAGGRRGRELAWLLREDAARRTALARGGAGPVDRATAALVIGEALRAGRADLNGLHLTLAGFDDLDPVQQALVVALGRSGADVLLSLPYAHGREALVAAGPLVQRLQDAGARTEEVPFDPEVVAVHPTLAAVGARLYEAMPAAEPVHADAAGAEPSGAVTELQAAGPDEELALIAELVEEERAGGTPAERIAVLTARPELHGPAIVAALARRGIPAYLGGRPAAASSPIVRGVIALLRARGGDGTALDLVAWLRLVDRERADQLDAVVRRRDARTVGDALGLWRLVGGDAVEELSRLREAERSTARPGSLERTVAAILGERALAWATDGATGCRPDAGTERAVRAAREAARAMESRAQLVERAWALTPRVALAADLADLQRALEDLRLEADPEPPGAVAVVGPLAVRTRTYDVLVIARAQRGTFPAAESARRALSPADRGVLAAEHGWPVPVVPVHAAAERYLAYEIATTPIRRLVLGWHAGDGDGGACEPSPLVAEVRRAAGGDLEVRRLAAGAAALRGLSPARRAAVEQAAHGPRHREVVHTRSEHLAAERRDHYAVRALQTASRCTAQWFVEQHLRPRPLDPDAAPLTAGRLRHDVLAEVLRGALEAGCTLAPDTLPTLEAGLAAAARRREQEATRQGETLGERLLRERVIAEIEATLPALCGSAPLAHQPSEIELSFGVAERASDAGDGADTGRPPVVVRRGDHELALSGRIDRLDISPDGRETVVVDYKGANVEPYRGGGWIERRELQAGLYALVAEELTGGRAVGSLYQAVPGPPDVPPRGATVERLADRGMRARSRDVIGPDDWDALLDELVRLAAEAAAAIDDGVVAPCAARCSDDGCRHPWLCRESRG